MSKPALVSRSRALCNGPSALRPSVITRAVSVSSEYSSGARARSLSLRNRLRDDKARPSGSRTVATWAIDNGRCKSSTILRTTCSCCQSFSPKYARSGLTWPNNFAQTVATPQKCPGRAAPSQFSAGPVTEIVVASSCGYIVSGSGSQTNALPHASRVARSPASSRGYRDKSSAAPNCRGLTKIDVTAAAPDVTAERTNARWPSCKAPMVGTRAIASCDARRSATAERKSARVRATRMVRSLVRPRSRGNMVRQHGRPA